MEESCEIYCLFRDILVHALDHGIHRERDDVLQQMQSVATSCRAWNHGLTDDCLRICQYEGYEIKLQHVRQLTQRMVST